jgi:hypothetical protein
VPQCLIAGDATGPSRRQIEAPKTKKNKKGRTGQRGPLNVGALDFCSPSFLSRDATELLSSLVNHSHASDNNCGNVLFPISILKVNINFVKD